MVRTITSGVSVVMAITVGKWPIPNKMAAKIMASQIPFLLVFQFLFF